MAAVAATMACGDGGSDGDGWGQSVFDDPGEVRSTRALAIDRAGRPLLLDVGRGLRSALIDRHSAVDLAWDDEAAVATVLFDGQACLSSIASARPPSCVPTTATRLVSAHSATVAIEPAGRWLTIGATGDVTELEAPYPEAVVRGVGSAVHAVARQGGETRWLSFEIASGTLRPRAVRLLPDEALPWSAPRSALVAGCGTRDPWLLQLHRRELLGWRLTESGAVGPELLARGLRAASLTAATPLARCDGRDPLEPERLAVVLDGPPQLAVVEPGAGAAVARIELLEPAASVTAPVLAIDAERVLVALADELLLVRVHDDEAGARLTLDERFPGDGLTGPLAGPVR